MKTMTRTEKCDAECSGCEYEIQSVPRTLAFREIWTRLSPTCEAKQRTMRDAANETARLRVLQEEFT